MSDEETACHRNDSLADAETEVSGRKKSVAATMPELSEILAICNNAHTGVLAHCCTVCYLFVCEECRTNQQSTEHQCCNDGK